MKQWSILSLSLVMGGLSTGIAYSQTPLTPEVLFSDGFESGTLANWPFTAASTSSAGTASVAPVIVGPSTGSGDSNVVRSGTKSAKMIGRTTSVATVGDPLSIPRIRQGGVFTRSQTNAETLLITVYIWDVVNQAGYPTTGSQTAANQRFWFETRGTNGAGNPFTSPIQIIGVAMSNSTTSNTANPGLIINGALIGVNTTTNSMASFYAARLVNVSFGNGSGFASGSNNTATGNTAPGSVFLGFGDTTMRRSNGWRKMTMAYSVGKSDTVNAISIPGVVQYFVDSKMGFFWTHNVTGTDPRRLDSIVLNNSETPSVDVWVDDVSVRSFPSGSVQILPSLGDVMGGANVTTVPISVTLTPTSGNTNPGASWTQNMNSDGEILATLPSNVRGSYDLTLDGGSWLKKTRPVVISEHGLFEFKVPMQNGDVDGSGEVDAIDIDNVIANFGATGVPSTQGDVDLSGEVDAIDIDIVIANFGGVDG